MGRYHVEHTCRCGATMQADGTSYTYVNTQSREFRDAHAGCLNLKAPEPPTPRPAYGQAIAESSSTWAQAIREGKCGIFIDHAEKQWCTQPADHPGPCKLA